MTRQWQDRRDGNPQTPQLAIEHKQIILMCQLDRKPCPTQIWAYVSGGLALHCDINGSGRTISHTQDSLVIRSGIRHSLKYLCLILQEMAALTNWSRPYHEVANDLVSNPELNAKYKALLEKLADDKEPSESRRY